MLARSGSGSVVPASEGSSVSSPRWLGYSLHLEFTYTSILMLLSMMVLKVVEVECSLFLGFLVLMRSLIFV